MIKKYLRSIIKNIKYRYSKLSYSQEGKDCLLAYHFREKFWNKKYKGFYIDVGAHHPYRYSNTYMFYQRNWSGIVIDPLPISNLFKSKRPRDKFINCTIADKNEEIEFRHFFDNPEISTILQIKNDLNMGKMLKSKIEARTLNSVFNENLPENKKIDFLSIDIDGGEYAALSNFNFINISENKLHCLLLKKSYKFEGKLVNSYLYVDSLSKK